MAKNIRCAVCRYTAVDKNASGYTKKHCKDCELDSGCTCGKKPCECGKGCENKGTDIVCPKQELKWAAYRCICKDSDYFKALLNVSESGSKQEGISWSGCEFGERRRGS